MARPPKKPISVAKTHSARRRKGGAPPRMTHGTRVAFNITCAECGADDTLPFVPKNTDEVLCSKCARERYGDDWDRGRSEKPAEFEFDCAACGEHDVVPFMPDDPTAPMLCKMCSRGIEKPVHGRIEGEIIDRKAGVRKRKA